jgi:putative ABC transport system permease protein
MQILRDLRHAGRMIRRMPGLAAVVVSSLGVGIAANTVVFSWVEAVVLKPIPGVNLTSGYHLVEPRTETGGYPGASWLEYRDLREQLRSFEDLMAFRMIPLYLGESGRIERASALLVSDNYFSSLGLAPAIGRFPSLQEMAKPGGPPVVVISYDYWQTRYGGSPTVVGQTVRVNAADLTIIGVAPRGFKGTVMRLVFDFWLPATLAPAVLKGSRDLQDRSIRGYTVAGNLAAGVSREQAQTAVDLTMRQLAQAYPQTNRTTTAEVLPYWKSPRGPQRMMGTSLALLQVIMLLLLLAVCGNTANLVLARASARQREMGVRLALGAGRWRIASLLLAENLLVALLGGAVGAALAVWGTSLMNAMPPMRVRGIPISFETHVDVAGLLFALALGVGCGIAFGLAPALQLSRVETQQTLRAGASAPRRSRLRNALMAVEVALAVVVLVAAGIFLRSFMSTRNEDPGFTRAGVLLASYDMSGRNLKEDSFVRVAGLMHERLGTLPGVEAVSIASAVPLDIHGMPSRVFTLEGRARSDDNLDDALTNTVTPGYFAVMKLPILEGHDFADLRDVAAPPQVIVNDAFVRKYLDGASPLGRYLETRGRKYTIVGVVKTSLYNAFGEPPTPLLYFSFRDRPSPAGEIHLRVRSGSETAVTAGVRRIVREIDPELPVFDVRTLTDHIEANLIFRRIPARMFSVLAPLLLLLAAIGIYAVVAYSVSQRTAEIGVRLALGATGPRLIAQFVAEHMAIIGAGALVGWVLVFGVVVGLMSAPADPAVFAGVPIILLIVATLASWWPARRVTRVDPMRALKVD